MMPRTVVQIDQGATGFDLRIRRTPIALRDDQTRPKPWNCPLAALPDRLSDYGGTLLKSLMDSHPGVCAALQAALAVVPPDRRPLYFQLTAQQAESIYWEMLYQDPPVDDFLALDRRWPIGRIADSFRGRSSLPLLYDPPLRLMLVLSALGVPAEPEWLRIRQVVNDARQKGFPVRVQVLAGESSLVESIEKEQKAGELELLPLPTTRPAVERAIEDFKPHVLHFFCHGAAIVGNPELHLATAQDHLTGLKSSVVLTRIGMMNLLALPNMWLLILNCCEGAKGAGGASLTYSLVNGGVPAAVGMLERVEPSAAHAFTEQFHTAMFDYLSRNLNGLTSGQVVELEWIEAMYDARQALIPKGGNASQDRGWALPVLYVANESFQVQYSPAALDDFQQNYNGIVDGFIENQPPYMQAYLRTYFKDIVAGKQVPPPPVPSTPVPPPQ
jgi:hypothetical protein